MSGFSVRLTHKVMAIGIVGLIGLLAFAAIYQAGSWSQDASRLVAKSAREISDLSKQLSIEMLEARRNEKNFQQRRNETYAKSHSAAAIASPVVPEITAKLATYQKEFAAWAETAQQTAAYDASMMKTFRGFEPLMVEIAQGVERLYREAEAAEASTRDAVRTWMLIAFALSVVLVCGLSFLIGRSISNALASMVSAMTRLAGGDVRMAIPG